MGEFRMPSLGSDMEAGVLVRWRCAVGDRVTRGTILAEVETDKGIIEVEAYEPGVVEKMLVQPGAKVPVGTPLALIGATASSAATVGSTPVSVASPAVSVASPAASVASPVAPAAPPAASVASHDDRHVAMSPLARRRAREAGIDPARVSGTGPHGAITVEDLERHLSTAATTKVAAVSAASLAAAAPLATPPSPASPPTPATAASRMRRAIAATMARSKREIPHYYVATTIDLSATLRWLESANASRTPATRLLPGLLFVRAAARAVAKVPEINGRWSSERDEAETSRDVHVGVAVSLRGGGLVAPAIRDTAVIALDALATGFLDVVQRARAGTLRSSEMGDGTITVTSLGDRGVETVFPIIIPPQLAIVGFGKVVERPWAVDGMLAVRPVVHVTLGADHRATDGHRGAIYLAEIARLLAAPEELT